MRAWGRRPGPVMRAQLRHGIMIGMTEEQGRSHDTIMSQNAIENPVPELSYPTKGKSPVRTAALTRNRILKTPLDRTGIPVEATPEARRRRKGFDKSAARREYEELYDKVVTNPHKFLEERYPQIKPESYPAEVNAMRYFGPTAEEAAIQVLTLIDWAAEYVKLSNSPVPDIPAFLQSPFVAGGTAAKNPFPTDPAASLRGNTDVRTTSQSYLEIPLHASHRLGPTRLQ